MTTAGLSNPYQSVTLGTFGLCRMLSPGPQGLFPTMLTSTDGISEPPYSAASGWVWPADSLGSGLKDSSIATVGTVRWALEECLCAVT